MEKPNLIQQCTDPSEDKINNDSQQASDVSQYFKQDDLEGEAEDNYAYQKLQDLKPNSIGMY